MIMARGDNIRTGSTQSYSSYGSHFYEKPFFQTIIVLSIIATLIISILAFVNVYQLKKTLIPTSINMNNFLKKLTSHEEMKSYVGVAPLNIVQINNNNFANLQTQIKGLDTSYIGSFIVQYTDRIIIYDYKNYQIKGTVTLQQPQQGQLPSDFLAKLNKHVELQGLENQQPIGGQLDEASLNTLKQQFPDVYKDAKVGDYLLRYTKKLIIYDYKQNKIVNAVNLG